jgi:hypothetical protein
MRRSFVTKSTSSKQPNLSSAIANLTALIDSPDSATYSKARASIAECFQLPDSSPDFLFLDALTNLLNRTLATTNHQIYLDRYLSIALQTLNYAPFLISALTVINTTTCKTHDRDESDGPDNADLENTRSKASLLRRLTMDHAPFRTGQPGSAAYFVSAAEMIDKADCIVRKLVGATPLELSGATALMREAMSRPHTRSFLEVNLHDGTQWFDRDRYGDLVSWFAILSAIRVLIRSTSVSTCASAYEAEAVVIVEWIRRWIAARDGSGYIVDELIRLLETEDP